MLYLGDAEQPAGLLRHSGHQGGAAGGKSLGGDVVFSEEFAEDPSFASLARELEAERQLATLRGFQDPVPYYRITEEMLVSRRTAEASDGST